MVQVINNKVVQTQLPCCGYLSNGDSVSGYNLLPQEVLKAEGWLPLEENKPQYDETTQYLEIDNYTILESKVTANYKVVDIV